MKNQRKIRPNLTNYDVLEILERELREAEKRIVQRTTIAILAAIFGLGLFIFVFVSSHEATIKNYAAEAMRKAFETERAIHIIDEAAGTNFLEQSKGARPRS
ncbi:hypothetical protein [Photobacterium lutimaris]|uniref:Uncharacterized protein n=1 Tax=Photobacterium lutimaris TaxID=388278 RepID=A0A2T3J4K0_9GAMM|nr:hypothetical protein [Photobacterium lutimaris]PSU36163.1 hypothetical protein C9I99_03955 [Photobacterium lutimaris]TDR74968.1 hypothetical protein DFP78_106299 [Photobacterium lutimaris]